MDRISGIFFAVAGLIAAGTSTSVMADNLLGVYVGAGVGEARVGNNNKTTHSATAATFMTTMPPGR
jgi:hypothetical protein